MTPFEFHRDQVVYSRYGAYLSFTWRKHALLMQSMFNGLGNDDAALFKLDVVDSVGEPVAFTVRMMSDHLRLDSASGHVEICITGDATAQLQTHGVGLRLTRDTAHRQFDNAYSPDGERWEVNAYDAHIKAGLRGLAGTLHVDAPWNRVHSDHIMAELLPGADGKGMMEIHLYKSVWEQPSHTPASGFEDHRSEAQQSFEAWLAETIPVPQAWLVGRELAAYINWSAVVSPRGYFKRPAMLMSKNWMTKVWSWDNCFNALALAEQDPALAWDQLMLFFDHQDTTGAIPDHLTDASRSFRFYKPPVHGWTLRQLMRTPGVVDAEKLAAIYEPLGRWTNWWFQYRDDDHDGLPQYNHGNESGWDNGTIFAEGVPVESPDLAAYLVIQMDVLAEVAAQLGHQAEAQEWQQRANDLLALMLEHLWNGTQFVARQANTHDTAPGDSSLVFMPLILGERLPQDVRDRLVQQLRRFETDHGIASEHPESPFYEADGYWRGPIWAPSTHLLVDGLLACGAHDFAYSISRKFCDMAQKSGMAENYDAQTGAALRDRAYTWTASVFLLLGNLLLHAED